MARSPLIVESGKMIARYVPRWAVTIGTSKSGLRLGEMAQTARKEVLIVEDEPMIRMVAADALADRGMSTWEAENALEALDVLTEHPEISLLFTDVHMPGEMTGVDLVRHVHRILPHVELLVTSGALVLANDDLPDHGTFLPKPYRVEKLVSIVCEKLAR